MDQPACELGIEAGRAVKRLEAPAVVQVLRELTKRIVEQRQASQLALIELLFRLQQPHISVFLFIGLPLVFFLGIRVVPRVGGVAKSPAREIGRCLGRLGLGGGAQAS